MSYLDRTFVPSLSRADRQITIPKFCPWGILVVNPEEEEEYRQHNPDTRILTVPEGMKGIAKVRRWILESFPGKVIMLDDDLRFYYRNVPGDWHLKYATPEQTHQLFDLIWMDLNRYAHGGVSAREGNNRLPDEMQVNCRLLRMLCYNTKLFPDTLEYDRVEVMEDFDIQLQLLRAGLPNFMFTKWAQGQPGTQDPGGCSTYRTGEVQRAAALRLAELHPGLVRVVEKNDKGKFGKRTDVRISWKKAYGSAVHSDRQ